MAGGLSGGNLRVRSLSTATVKPKNQIPMSPMKSRTNVSSSWLQGRLLKSTPVIVRVAALLLLTVLAAGQMAQAQTPVLAL